MANTPNFRMRVFFKKTGRLSMLSHLEVARTLERIVRRAGLPYAISQGFSPHMKISFGSALPVGVGSECECFDLQLTEYVQPEKAREALRAMCVDDLMVYACEHLGEREPASSVAFPISVYRAQLSSVPASPLCVPDSIVLVRKRKERVLRPRDFLIGEIVQNEDILEFTLQAKPEGSLSSSVLLTEILKQEPPIHVLSITRIAQRVV